MVRSAQALPPDVEDSRSHSSCPAGPAITDEPSPPPAQQFMRALEGFDGLSAGSRILSFDG
ncbi:hypothetical protein BMF89_03855 [Arthrobacter sp. SRS-W-1-2016]|uniref:hypothetical protein n=1 Tax=Arthrobacter sp. SRS-W-1-2016 TaxID=1930254 RepID=UPI000990C1BC|nr:hypothetical protein [Arthrobacter sp. SRS-W-1-2016]OOP64320.1 hypothetical protein BMF89_03855 [Arthrobacter sp. SRS-W-1-2016]